MLVLGIETSCDETAAALVEHGDAVRFGDVRSNVIASQTDLHSEYGGVVPEIASRAHAERTLPVVRRALSEAGVGLADVDGIAVGHRPGLIGSLLVGVAAAKALSWSLGVPLVGVDHVHAHLYAGLLDGRGAAFPALGLVVSGGHTALYECASAIEVRRLGGTIDDAAGEAFDKAAAILGLGFPGGPSVDGAARAAGADDRAVELPVSRLGPDSLDFSFSGLKTALLYEVRGKPRPRADGGGFERDASSLSEERRRDLAATFERAVVEAIVIKLGRASDRTPEARTLLCGGGVIANTRLRAALESFAAERGLELRLPAMELCVDNAAMIAGLGGALLASGKKGDLTLTATPTTGC